MSHASNPHHHPASVAGSGKSHISSAHHTPAPSDVCEPMYKANPDGVDEEKLYHLGRSRAGFASSVTRQFGKLMQAIEDTCGASILKERFGHLEEAFLKYRGCHMKYMHLAAELQPDKAERGAKQFTDVEALMENAE